MSERKLEVWEPIENFNGSLHFKEMMYGEEGLKFIFNDNLQNEFHFTYGDFRDGMFVWAVRFTEEFKRGDLVEIASEARKTAFGADNKEWCFYKMTDSDFINWHDQLSGPSSEAFSVEHHLFVTTQDTFEVISEYEPKVTVKKSL
ncbi:hypothetical protein K8O68_10405 [Salipaludibacillus sp. CUR1]|uniref:hypothetical protein n=1 Tax=Salipaludibacillus sp. CUR1 TaxID=2820003 RepID=UPI001E2FB675|nr:hypothetical protein [Salipaludibacillus sp. CUR1]MCE7792826.1 hypothetical protein [Salipaludibacillus sp. CUR1]